MISNRKIYVIGDIDWEAYENFSKQVTRLELESKKKDETIFIELASDGGDAHVAIAFASRIRMSPCTIHIVAVGNVASAAVLVLAAGDNRRMATETWCMVHEDTAELNGSVVELERESKQLRRQEVQWAKLLENLTGTAAEFWEQMHKETTYLTAENCLELGLVDSII